MKKALRIAVLGALVVLAGMQLFRVSRTNPPVTGDIAAPPEIKAILRSACYDCHSHETVWPWYSRVAPASWLVGYDVRHARKMLNFSVWTDHKPEKKTVLLEDAVAQVSAGEMPPVYYTWMHPKSRLSGAQVDALSAWAKSGEANK